MQISMCGVPYIGCGYLCLGSMGPMTVFNLVGPDGFEVMIFEAWG